MCKSKYLKRVISILLVFSMSFSIMMFGTSSASAFKKGDITNDGMQTGYSILNGYTKQVLKNADLNQTQSTAVYSGLDVTSPYLMVLVGVFYINQSVNLEKMTTDNAYAMQIITKLDGFLHSMGVRNDKAKGFKDKLVASSANITSSFDTVGLYIFDATNLSALNLINEDDVDFVIAGGRVPDSLKDLNFDGKSNNADAALIQQYLSGELKFEDADENNYALYASDINADESIDILDVTDLQNK